MTSEDIVKTPAVGLVMRYARAASIVILAQTVGTIPFVSMRTAAAQGVEVDELRSDFERCHALSDADARLKCYDGLQSKLEPPTYQGSLAEETPLFDVSAPTLLRYQSDGPIFVMYLKDANGAVVQNLHIGGGGESTYLIAKSGTYNLQVSGSDTWRIWVEPQGPGGKRG